MSKITDSARGSTCIRCGAPDAYAAHYNGIRQHQYGKGRGIKCHDLASAEFCHVCDQRFSEGKMVLDWRIEGHPLISKSLRSEEFLHWVMLTNIRRMERGDL